MQIHSSLWELSPRRPATPGQPARVGEVMRKWVNDGVVVIKWDGMIWRICVSHVYKRHSITNQETFYTILSNTLPSEFFCFVFLRRSHYRMIGCNVNYEYSLSLAILSVHFATYQMVIKWCQLFVSKNLSYNMNWAQFYTWMHNLVLTIRIFFNTYLVI